MNSVLRHARIVHPDRVDERAIAFSHGRVVGESPVDAIEIDLRDHLVLPGLINAHDHLQLNAVPRMPHAAPFANSYAWIDRMDAHRERADVAAAVAVPRETRLRHGALKNLLAGTTTVAHHDPWHAAFDACFAVHVAPGLDWCHSLGLADDARYGPASGDRARDGRPWVIHVAEGTDAVARGELAMLDARGLLDANTILVHGVGLGNADVTRVIDVGAAVVWCPSSNLELLGATLDPRRLADAHRLALGTDARLTGARDLLDELRVAASVSDLTSRELLRLVTTDASAMLRLTDRGRLGIGSVADCVIIRAADDPYRALLDTQRHDVRAVVHDGVPLVADPDLAEWMAQCGVDAIPIRVDGREKHIARWLVPPDVVALEPGLAR